MTDRVVTLTVILDKEYRVDDVEYITNAIQMIRGVHSVENGPVADASHYMNKETIALDFRKKIMAVLDPKMWDRIKDHIS